METHGGKRPGAGRPRKSEKYARPIAVAERRIADRLPILIDRMFELSDGLSMIDTTDDEPRIYTKPPDRLALEYLINRIMGKPIERHEHDIDAEINTLMEELVNP